MDYTIFMLNYITVQKNIKYFKVSLVKNAKSLYAFVCLPHFMIERKTKEKMMVINLNKL